jgi:hypothetical protein
MIDQSGATSRTLWLISPRVIGCSPRHSSDSVIIAEFFVAATISVTVVMKLNLTS